MLMTVMFLVLLILVGGFVVDLGRAWIAREHLQTAVDAASLAGAKGGIAKKYVEVSVIPGWCTTCCDEYGCYCCCNFAPSPVRRSGEENYILGQGGWAWSICDLGPWLEERWIEFSQSGQGVVEQVLKANWTNPLPVRSRITTYDEYSPYYPSVVVSAEAKVETTLAKIVGIEEIPVRVFSQAAVYYTDVHGGWEYGRSASPEMVPSEEV